MDTAKAALIAFTKNGIETERRIAQVLSCDGWDCGLWAMGKALAERLAERSEDAAVSSADTVVVAGENANPDSVVAPVEGSLAAWAEHSWQTCDALIFVGAAGIAVRAIAPHVKKKTEDPAVVVVDERGQFVISLLSGHMGGANQLARRIAAGIGAMPVITTATDVNDLLSVDQWAKEQGLTIDSMSAAKEISARLLSGETVGVYSRWPVAGTLPKGLVWRSESVSSPPEGGGQIFPDPEIPAGIVISDRTADRGRFAVTLQLIPKSVVLGMGCRRNIAGEKVRELAGMALEQAGIHRCAVGALASIDIKKDEGGLLALAAEWGIPFLTYSAEQLAAVSPSPVQSLLDDRSSQTLVDHSAPEATGQNAPKLASSAFVKSITGVDNVCERAALLAAGEKSRLIVRKTAREGVTVAVAEVAAAMNGTATIGTAMNGAGDVMSIGLCWPEM